MVKSVAVALQYQAGQTPLDADELGQLAPKHITTQGQLNEWEQTNIVEALKWLKRGRHPAVLTEAFCRQLHKQMFGKTWKWAGTFRQSDKNIGGDWRQVSTQLRQLLDNTQFWVNDKVFPLDEIAVRFHHRLVLVHAFPNGNGRHARLMTDSLLNQAGGHAFSWGNEGSLVAGGGVRDSYLDALRTADAGDITKLMAFVRS
ncbi:mobile mystery protein B [Variovorax paradoxus]|uniref:mobile mystery protein B n=1 Tax=Variovorax paradoxus TaxID=34073 RepID=UPI0027828D97|nr:mobile mystery protein B [Variovorax paradoxus]MDQ0590711.1 Fic-DOC domain mobile mystery protein B [Variovorax paradoxus]